MVSTPCLVVSADRVDTAIAFQSAMTAGLPSDAGGGVAAAVAVPAERATRSGTTAHKASNPRTRAGRLREERRWLSVCILAPPGWRVTVVEDDDSEMPILLHWAKSGKVPIPP
jgi:hypothetical protein